MEGCWDSQEMNHPFLQRTGSDWNLSKFILAIVICYRPSVGISNKNFNFCLTVQYLYLHC